MLFVGVIVILFHIEHVRPVHSLDFPLGPDALVVICFEFGSCRCQPPEKIYPDRQLGILEEILLLAILLLQVVHIALIVVYRGDLLRQQVKSEVGEEKPLHERQY